MQELSMELQANMQIFQLVLSHDGIRFLAISVHKRDYGWSTTVILFNVYLPTIEQRHYYNTSTYSISILDYSKYSDQHAAA